MSRDHASPARQRGVTAVELGLVLLVFCALLTGIIGFVQLLWTLHSADEATYVGARLATVCDKENAVIKKRMREKLPDLRTDQIVVDYINRGNGATCFEDTPTNASNPSNTNVCRAVRVSLVNYGYDMVLPTGVLRIPLPSLSTTLPREYMSASNPICTL